MKHNKIFSAIISVVLVLTLCVTTCTSAFAATSSKKYIKEMIISYGETADEAKKWLTDNDYEVLDKNLNEGADDTFSTKRAVYIGYKTTDNKDEAITDMKLMNMKGGYSVQDYQMLLDEQKTSIKNFFNNFKVAIKEFRENYKDGQERAKAAYEILNTLYDDDTKQNIGDLLLNKVREEYTDEEYNALSDDEKAKVGDMTTILMQGNANAVLAIEQTIATATDDSDTLWTERYQDAKTYDEMVEDLADNENLTINEATKQLSAEYDADAKLIASNFENYKTYLENYTNSGITMDNTAEEIETYINENEDFDYTEWCALGTQYELLKVLKNDDVSLLDLITSDDYDVENDDRYMLYPLVASLTDGQRACLEFLSTYQLVALGINDDTTAKATMDEVDITSIEGMQNTSVYDGIDRTNFAGDVALTGEAYRLQTSTGQDVYDDFSIISTTSIVLYSTFVVSTSMMALSWVYNSHLSKIAAKLAKKAKDAKSLVAASKKCISNNKTLINEAADEASKATYSNNIQKMENALVGEKKKLENALSASKSASTWSKAFYYASIAMTCVTIALMVASLWSTYSDLKEYYNAEFTPIPSKMVNQGVNENDEKVYTYYNAVKCNREAQKMVTDNTKLLGDYGDLNGDVGRQWVALYTTTDSAAGNPITTDFTVQYNNTEVPGDSTPLSIFCESVAQNLTNKKAGYTYADSKNGIYLFYGTDSNAFAGSIISNSSYILVGGISAIIAAAIAFFAGKSVGGKKSKKENQ